MDKVNVVCIANRYNWPVKIDLDQFNAMFELTDDYLHGVIAQECIMQHMIAVKNKADIVIQGFDNIREEITVKRVTAALIK